jgi:hypothetical protein
MKKIACRLLSVGLMLLAPCCGLSVRHVSGDDAGSGATGAGDDHGGDGTAGAGDQGAAGGGPVPPCSSSIGPVEAMGIFVDVERGQDTAACGASTRACQSIQRGIDRAEELRRGRVYVAPGAYTEALTLVAGVTVEGGFQVDGTSWQTRCDPSARELVRVQAAPGSEVTVLADDLHGTAALRSLTVTSADELPQAIGASGASVYGVFARGASTLLYLENVTVAVNKAQDGGDGVNGVTGGSSASCDSPSDGASGVSAGADGSSGLGGTFTSAGYTPDDGSPGSDGQPGHNGTAPNAPATCVTNCGACVSSDDACQSLPDSCGTAGRLGCAGSAGGGGGGAFGGGSSVALYVVQATVKVHDSVLASGAGGRGGVGGAAGERGNGTLGAPGQPAANACYRCSITYVGYGNSGFARCEPTLVGTGSAGSAGGNGGDGTHGGRGGDGGPGASCALFQDADARVSIAGDSALSFVPPPDGSVSPANPAGVCG